LPVITYPPLEPRQLAYILYTSGSTGRPKGIAMPHEAVMNHYLWIVNHFKLNPSDRMLQHTPLTFDVSVCEFYSIISGGTLILLPEDETQDVMTLTRVIERDRITFLQIVPSLLETLLFVDIMDKLDSVRQVLCGADILKPQHLQRWHERKKIPLTNLYGPTEACVDSIFYDCDVSDSLRLMIPIGKPIAGVMAYLLNDKYLPTSYYAPGNLYIGGHGLARGYYCRPDLTALAFIPNPFLSGARMYHTRDRAKLDPNGDFLFLGRSDNQIKLRGLRIELDEIRGLMEAHPDVWAALVTASGEGVHQSLCGYYISRDELTASHWQDYLSNVLPSYMIPSSFMRLDAFPLTSHGKIDTSQLPTFSKRIEKPVAFSPTEIKVADCWSYILQIDRGKLDPNTNFFEFGGNSLAIIQVQYLLNKELENEIHITRFFEFPTIHSFASFLDGQESSGHLVEKLLHHAQMRKKYYRKKAKLNEDH